MQTGGCIASALPVEPIAGIIDRWLNGRAVVRLLDGQELIVARRHLPKESTLGDQVELHLTTPALAALTREELARAVLKEILQG